MRFTYKSIALIALCSLANWGQAQVVAPVAASIPQPVASAAVPSSQASASSSASTSYSSELGKKSADYIESLRGVGAIAGKPDTAKKVESTSSLSKKPEDKPDGPEKVNDKVATKDVKASSTTVAAQETNIVKKKKQKSSKKETKLVKRDTSSQESYVKQNRPVLYAVYPELSAVYSKGGVYFVILKIGDKTITAQDGESTVCGHVKVLSLNEVRVGSQTLTVR